MKTLQENQKVVDWYIAVMEDGVCAKELAREYFELKTKYKKLLKEFDVHKEESKAKEDKAKKKIDELRTVLKRQ